MSLWCAFHGEPQRKARLYTTLVESGLVSSVSGSLLPTIDPYLYTLSLTAVDGVALEQVEEAALNEIERVRTRGITESELLRAKRQLRARLIFENDSVTNIAHQLGYFATVAGGDYLQRLPLLIERVSADDVNRVARERLTSSKRTVGWFRPAPVRQ